MDVGSIGSQAGFAAATQTSGKRDLGQQEFLQLLVAQMRNQDPINPMDGAEFASQLAQFNSVEQLIGVNDGLEILQESQNMMSASLTNSMAAALTGKQVRALSNQVNLGVGEPANIQYKLNSDAENVEIVIRNASGAEVRRETLNGVPSGEQSWEWDGKNNAGDRMADGDYTVEINATNGESPVDSLVFIEGVATKVRYTGQGVFLSVNNVEVPIGDIEQVGTGLF
jgi:flagellar basal-body rod modification protein FlgD